MATCCHGLDVSPSPSHVVVFPDWWGLWQTMPVLGYRHAFITTEILAQWHCLTMIVFVILEIQIVYIYYFIHIITNQPTNWFISKKYIFFVTLIQFF